MARKFNRSNTSVVSGNWRVDLVDIGEGLNGDWQEDDPNDMPLLRFDMYSRKNSRSPWTEVSDSSYCTLVHADISGKQRKDVLTKLIEEVEDCSWDESVKKRCERLSHISRQPLDKRKKK